MFIKIRCKFPIAQWYKTDKTSFIWRDYTKNVLRCLKSFKFLIKLKLKLKLNIFFFLFLFLQAKCADHISRESKQHLQLKWESKRSNGYQLEFHSLFGFFRNKTFLSETSSTPGFWLSASYSSCIEIISEISADKTPNFKPKWLVNEIDE